MRRLVGLLDMRSRFWDVLLILTVLAGVWMVGAAAWRIFRAPPPAMLAQAAARDGPGKSVCDRLIILPPDGWGPQVDNLRATAAAGCRRAEEHLGLRLPEPVAVRWLPVRAEREAVCGRGAGGCWLEGDNTIIVPDPLDTRAIAHETAHALLSRVCGTTPISWVSEAIARDAEGRLPVGYWRDLAGVLAVTPRMDWGVVFYGPALSLGDQRVGALPSVMIDYPAAHALLTRLLLPHTIPEFTRALCDQKPEHTIADAFRRVTGRELDAALREAAGL